MAKDYSTQLSSIMITLANINDHLRTIEQLLQQQTKQEVQKHIVVVKTPPKKEKKDGKISN